MQPSRVSIALPCLRLLRTQTASTWCRYPWLSALTCKTCMPHRACLHVDQHRSMFAAAAVLRLHAEYVPCCGLKSML